MKGKFPHENPSGFTEKKCSLIFLPLGIFFENYFVNLLGLFVSIY